jgi:hypothetical protein
VSSKASISVFTPPALPLRLLETVVEVAAEKNSTLVLPVPVELRRFLDTHTQPPKGAVTPAAEESPPTG